jgi:hypothetical protein
MADECPLVMTSVDAMARLEREEGRPHELHLVKGSSEN